VIGVGVGENLPRHSRLLRLLLDHATKPTASQTISRLSLEAVH
jgi:hypothetical protein